MNDRCEYTWKQLETVYYNRRDWLSRDIDVKKEDMEAIGQRIAERPYGEIEARWFPPKMETKQANGGRLNVIWYTLHRIKYARMEVDNTAGYDRDFFGNVIRGPRFRLEEKYSRENAWRWVFEDRYNLAVSLRIRRALKKDGFIPPPKEFLLRRILDQGYGLALVTDQGFSIHCLCSPLGWIEVNANVSTVPQAMKAAGIEYPRFVKDRTWENIRPAWIMATLAR